MRPLNASLFALSLIILTSSFAVAQVTINEVMINDFSTDDSTYVELYGPAGTDLNGWQLVGVNGYTGLEYATINLTGVIPAGGFFVIGESDGVSNVDLIDPAVDFQNGPDNIQLKQGAAIIDAIGYGTFASPDTCFRGEGQPCSNQSNGSSLCRYPDGHDTNNNEVDFLLTVYLTPGEINDLGGVVPYYTLSELRAGFSTMLGQVVSTSGIATVPSTWFGGSQTISAYIQDDMAGINIFGGSWVFAPGDFINVTGTLAQYNNLLEVTSVTQLTIGPYVAPPAPIAVNCQIANNNGENLESMLVSLEDVWITSDSPEWPITGNNENILITDSSGDTLVLRIDKDTDLDGWAGHPDMGDHFDLTAILNQFGSTYQALPRYQTDIQLLGVISHPLPGILSEFSLQAPHPNPFNPATMIDFNLTRPGHVTLEAFTLNGSRAATLLHDYLSAGRYQTNWNASALPSGLYLVRLVTAEGTLTTKAVLIK
jgi:hypothetical protein